MSSGSRIGVRVLISIAVYAALTGVDAQSANQNGVMHLFLLAGQSNMAGRGRVADEDRLEHPRVRMLNRDNQWVLAVEPMHFDKPIAAVGPGRAFGVAIAESNPSIEIGLIPAAVGGSPVTAWEPGVLYPETGAYPWDEALRRTRAAMPAGTVKAILWHQGESDANPTNAPLYEERLRALIARFRVELGNPSLPFLIGQLGRFPGRPWNESFEQVDAVHRRVAAEVANVAFVSSEGLRDNGDNLHFDADGARELGRRYAAAYLKQTERSAACAPADGIEFVCGLESPEDLVVLPGDEWVVAGAYSGRGGINLIRVKDRVKVFAYPTGQAVDQFDTKTYRSACPGPPDTATKAKFQIHGLSLVPGTNSVHRLFAVLHGGRESVEVFEVDARPATPTVTWIGCAVAPEPVGLNSVRGLPNGGFVATNFLARAGGPDIKAVMAGQKNGELWEWHPGSEWQEVPDTEAAGANGLETSEDGRGLYVAAWGAQSFFRVTRGPAAPVRALRQEVPLGFRVDNIHWARDGSLLAAGQGETPASSIVVKINPGTLTVREILRHRDTPAFGAATAAVEVGRELWVGSFRGDRLAIFPLLP